MVGLLLLAGGLSRRMGHDKARMAGGVQRILQEAKAAGLTPRIVLAGPSPRASELERDGWLDDADDVLDDPTDATCLHDVLVHVLDGTLPPMVLTPCDAVLVDRETFSALATMAPGVPLDHEGRRQVLFSHVPEGWATHPHPHQRVEALFDGFTERSIGGFGSMLRTANTPEELATMTSVKPGTVEGDRP